MSFAFKRIITAMTWPCINLKHYSFSRIFMKQWYKKENKLRF